MERLIYNGYSQVVSMEEPSESIDELISKRNRIKSINECVFSAGIIYAGVTGIPVLLHHMCGISGEAQFYLAYAGFAGFVGGKIFIYDRLKSRINEINERIEQYNPSRNNTPDAL